MQNIALPFYRMQHMLEQILLGVPALLVRKSTLDYNLPAHPNLALKVGCKKLGHHQPLMLDASALHSHLCSPVSGFCENSSSVIMQNNILKEYSAICMYFSIVTKYLHLYIPILVLLFFSDNACWLHVISIVDSLNPLNFGN